MSGTSIVGPVPARTTNVVFIVTDPVVSVAVIWITGSVSTSASRGVPERVLVAPSRESHDGALDNV